METPETSCREALKRYLEEFTSQLKKEQEETEGGGEEQLICSSQDDPGESGSTTSDMIPQSSCSSVPTLVLNNPMEHWVFFTIQSVSSHVNLGCQLDLKHICKNTWNTECSIEDSHLAAMRFARIVQKQGYNVRFQNFRTVNIIASSKLFPVNLEELYNAHRERSSYNQELSPFLKLKLDDGITANIFHTGNTILFGAKNPAQLHEAVKALFYILRSFMTFKHLEDESSVSS